MTWLRIHAAVALQGNDDEDDMLWDYGGPKAHTSGSTASAALKVNGSAQQRPNGVQPDGAFGTTMSPEFKVQCSCKITCLLLMPDMNAGHYGTIRSEHATAGKHFCG